MIKHFINLLTGEFAARGLQAVAMILLTRQLGKEGAGVFGLAVALAAYGQVCVMLGIDPLAVRGLAQKTLDAHAAVGRIFSLRLAIAAALILAAVLWTLTGKPPGAILPVLSLSLAAQAMTPRWLLLAKGATRIMAISGVLAQVLFLAVVVLAPHGAMVAAAGAAAGEALAAAYCFRAARTYRAPMALHWDGAFNRAIVREARPLLVVLLMGVMMMNFDVLALSLLGRHDQVGLYVSAYRPLTFLAPVLGVLQNAILPHFTAAWPAFSKIRREMWLFSAIAGGAMAAAAGLLCWQAPLILRLLFGAAFEEGTPMLRILAWSLVPQGLRSVMRLALFAFKQEQVDSWNVRGAAATNVILDFALIPHFGAVGCAISTVAAESVYLAATFEALRRRVMRDAA